MMGLAFLFGFGVYLAISYGVVKLAMFIARNVGGRPRLWGMMAGLVMYHLVFWDLIPTLVAHKYYCATEAGFWVYKTPEQWKLENPGVFETLDISHLPEQYRFDPPSKYDREQHYLLPDGTQLATSHDGAGKMDIVRVEQKGYTDGYQLNERIRQLYRDRVPTVLSIKRNSGYLIDTKNNEVLAEFVDFRRGYAPLSSGGTTLNDWKVWLVCERCGSEVSNNLGKFMSFSNNYKGEVK